MCRLSRLHGDNGRLGDTNGPANENDLPLAKIRLARSADLCRFDHLENIGPENWGNQNRTRSKQNKSTAKNQEHATRTGPHRNSKFVPPPKPRYGLPTLKQTTWTNANQKPPTPTQFIPFQHTFHAKLTCKCCFVPHWLLGGHNWKRNVSEWCRDTHFLAL